MRQIVSPKIIVILGPTASGKSALAVRIARLVGGEVVSADSRQVYCGLDIGSGKITEKEMQGVRHHMLDVASPRRIFTAADYRIKAERAVQGILKKGKVPVVCGGTGFYIDALLYGLSLPPVPPNPRLREELERLSTDELFAELEEKDPVRAATIDRKNRRRLIRALEIVRSTGRPVPILERTSGYDALLLGLAPLRSELHLKIARRLKARLPGMLAEARRLRLRGLSLRRMEELGLEYRYLARHLAGSIDKKTMVTELEREIVKYAKRQMTWFKKNKDIHWVSATEAARLARGFIGIKKARQ